MLLNLATDGRVQIDPPDLASLNLLKFLTLNGRFDVAGFRHAVNTLILAQEILVDRASYPTSKIAQNSHDFRPLGLGYANLGALLMSMGVPYDSDHGRDFASAITSVMCGQAYLTSSRVAGSVGPFPGYNVNEQPFLEVIRMHRDSAGRIAKLYCARAAQTVCETAIQVHGGIGNTWECLAHVYLRRAMTSAELFAVRLEEIDCGLT